MHSGDPHEEFTELLAAHRNRVFGYLFALVQNLSDTEDLFQQVSLVLWRNFADYQPGTDFGKWACAVARFEVLNFQRTRGRSRLLFDEATVAQLATIEAGRESELAERRSAALARCLEKLSDRQRQLVEQFYDQQRNPRQLADERRQSLQSVYNALSRIRRTLFECINRALAEQDAR